MCNSSVNIRTGLFAAVAILSQLAFSRNIILNTGKNRPSYIITVGLWALEERHSNVAESVSE